MALRPIEIILRAVGADTVKSAFTGVGDSATQMGAKVKAAGDTGKDAFAGAEARAKQYWGTVDEARSKTENLTRSVEAFRNGAAAFTAVSAGVALFANHLSDSFLEADRLGGKLESMLSGKGLSAGIEQVKQLGNEIAGLTGGDDDQIATAIAGAIASGRLNGLREYGIVVSAEGQAAIEAAGKISEQAKAQETLNQVLIAGGAAAGVLRAGMDESTIALGEFNVRWGNLEEGIGQGAAKAKAAILGGLFEPLMRLAEANPGLQDTIGYILYIGGSAGSVIGSVLTLGSQAALTAMSLKTMGITGVGSFAAIRTGAIAAGAATWAAIAPLLPLILAIAAGVALVVGGLYLWIKADLDKAAADKKLGDEADRKSYDLANDPKNKNRTAADPRVGESFEEWKTRTGRGAEDSEFDAENGTDPHEKAAMEAASLSAKIEGLQNGGAGSMPAMPMPSMSSAVSFPVASSGTSAPASPATVTAIRAAGKAQESAAKAAERTAKIEEEGALADEKRAIRLRKLRTGDEFDLKIEALEDEVEKAKAGANDAKVRQLTYRLALLKAEKDKALAKLDADSTGLENEKDADVMDQEAKSEFDRKKRQALREFNSSGASSTGSRDVAIRALRALRGGGGIGGGYTSTFRGYETQSLPGGSALNPGGASSREVGRNQRMLANGDVVTKLEVEVISPYQGIGRLGDSR
jgi:hypothetical protein